MHFLSHHNLQKIESSNNNIQIFHTMKLINTTFLTLSLVGGAGAFSPNTIKSFASTTKLHSFAIDSDEDAMHMMMRADACAHSDSCSIDDAEHFIAEILTLQSDCLSGSLSDDEVCEDVTFPAEVIASLREKIAKETR